MGRFTAWSETAASVWSESRHNQQPLSPGFQQQNNVWSNQSPLSTPMSAMTQMTPSNGMQMTPTNQLTPSNLQQTQFQMQPVQQQMVMSPSSAASGAMAVQNQNGQVMYAVPVQQQQQVVYAVSNNNGQQQFMQAQPVMTAVYVNTMPVDNNGFMQQQ